MTTAPGAQLVISSSLNVKNPGRFSQQPPLVRPNQGIRASSRRIRCLQLRPSGARTARALPRPCPRAAPPRAPPTRSPASRLCSRWGFLSVELLGSLRWPSVSTGDGLPRPLTSASDCARSLLSGCIFNFLILPPALAFLLLNTTPISQFLSRSKSMSWVVSAESSFTATQANANPECLLSVSLPNFLSSKY